GLLGLFARRCCRGRRRRGRSCWLCSGLLLVLRLFDAVLNDFLVDLDHLGSLRRRCASRLHGCWALSPAPRPSPALRGEGSTERSSAVCYRDQHQKEALCFAFRLRAPRLERASKLPVIPFLQCVVEVRGGRSEE